MRLSVCAGETGHPLIPATDFTRVYHLKRRGGRVGRKRVRRLMAKMGLAVMEGRILMFPHLWGASERSRAAVSPSADFVLASLASPGESSVSVSSSRIGGHPARSGVVHLCHLHPDASGLFYLVAIMDWYSRWVLSWRLSNTLEPSFCCEALEEALNRYDPPEIFNTDQGSQFISTEFTGLLKEVGVRILMDGRGRWMDNIFIERLWRSLKYECVYLNAFETGTEARRGIGQWIDLYNTQRPHSSHGGLTPMEVHGFETAGAGLVPPRLLNPWRQSETMRSPP